MTTNTITRRRLALSTLLTAIVATAILTGGAPAFGADEARCLSVAVEAPIVLPSGEEHPPGRLVLCATVRYSPVASLHRTAINGRTVGLLMSRRVEAELRDEQPASVMFERDADGRLELIGYVVPGERSSATFFLADPSPAARRVARGERSGGVSPAIVVLAARGAR